jgi:hypothetical protein
MTQISPSSLGPQERKWKSDAIKIFLTAIFVGFLLVLGIIGGDFYYDKTVKLTPEWQNLGSPSEPIIEFVQADFFTVFVRGESGQLYSCYWESQYLNDCWEAIKEIPESIDYCDGWSLNELKPDELQKPPVGNPTQSTYDYDCATWAGSPYLSMAIYHLLDDGSVMQWYDDETTLTFHGYLKKRLINIFVGSIMGITIGIFISIKMWQSTRF